MPEKDWQVLLPPLLASAGLDATAAPVVEPLTGGVSSDIVRVTLSDGRRLCAKRALPKLKVASDWQAPLERNHFEAAWLGRAGAIVPGVAPAVIAEDSTNGIVLLDYLPSEDFLLWKTELLGGRADPATPARVGDALGRIHAATLGDAAVAAEFATDTLFDALRLDPYLRTLAARQPALAAPILACLEETRTTKLALVHGDVSPKNILVSRRDGHPVLLDAECAWYGDPVFDAAFCLNHLLLKAVHVRSLSAVLPDQALTLFSAWIDHLPLGLRKDAERRTATLLPCLMLARVDGKSPVEYLDAAEQQRVRDIAIPIVASPPATIGEVVQRVRMAAEAD
jgi:tRNA A-37 threonylcarbamoyl transferase component Bud32